MINLISLTNQRLSDIIAHFNDQSNLIMASIVHNYTSSAEIPDVQISDQASFTSLFENILNFKTSFNPILFATDTS